MISVAQTRYRQLVEMSLDGIVLQTGGQIRFANPAAHRLIGTAPGHDIVGEAIDTFLAPPYLTAVHDELVEPDAQRTPFVERKLIRVDGSSIDVEVTAVPFVFEDRPSVQVVLRDIRERVASRRATLWAEAQFRLLAQQMPFVMWTLDPGGRVLTVIGDQTCPFGVRATAALRDGTRLVLRDTSPATEPDPVTGQRPTLQITVDDRAYAIRLEPIRDSNGEIGRLGVAFDVTPWLQAQELMRDALRIDAIGHLAGGVAHEINNILAIIRGQGEMLEREGDPLGHAHHIVVATARGAEITRNLLSFAMADVHRPDRLSLDALARDVADLMGPSARANVAIEVRPTPGLADVLADNSQLSRALMNLVLNAFDAMPSGGKILLETANLPPPIPGGPAWVRLRITDTGVGMSEEKRKRAFEPFFTDSLGPKRVGLGLSMVQGVILQHKGRIELRSRPGFGTTVSIQLPAADLIPKPPPMISTPSGRVGVLADVSARPKALVVDDERMLRMVGRTLVGMLGYEAVEASNGAAALALFRAGPQQFAFVLLDVLMPGMTGVEALGYMLAADPDVRVILCTGYPRGELGPDVFDQGHIEYLGKPYSREDLNALVSKVTGKRVG